jgi:hypothetical protein
MSRPAGDDCLECDLISPANGFAGRGQGHDYGGDQHVSLAAPFRVGVQDEDDIADTHPAGQVQTGHSQKQKGRPKAAVFATS